MNYNRSNNDGKRHEGCAATSIIVATHNELRTLIRDEVRAALAELRPAAPAAEQCEVVSYAAAETIAGVSASTLARAVKSGDLRPVRIGRAVRFQRDELVRWLAANAASPDVAAAREGGV